MARLGIIQSLMYCVITCLQELHIVKQIEEGLYICKYSCLTTPFCPRLFFLSNVLSVLSYPSVILAVRLSVHLSHLCLSICLLVSLSVCLCVYSISPVHLHHETTQCFIRQSRDFCILVSERSEVRQDLAEFQNLERMSSCSNRVGMSPECLCGGGGGGGGSVLFVPPYDIF